MPTACLVHMTHVDKLLAFSPLKVLDKRKLSKFCGDGEDRDRQTSHSNYYKTFMQDFVQEASICVFLFNTGTGTSCRRNTFTCV